MAGPRQTKIKFGASIVIGVDLVHISRAADLLLCAHKNSRAIASFWQCCHKLLCSLFCQQQR